jgi:hypothetical protein
VKVTDLSHRLKHELDRIVGCLHLTAPMASNNGVMVVAVTKTINRR